MRVIHARSSPLLVFVFFQFWPEYTVGLIVRGHVSEKSFSWAFYEHFSFFTETYSINCIKSTKRCLQFFESYVGPFYAN